MIAHPEEPQDPTAAPLHGGPRDPESTKTISPGAEAARPTAPSTPSPPRRTAPSASSEAETDFAESEPTHDPTLRNSETGSAFDPHVQGRVLLGRYEISRTLGAGGMASVHLAYDRTSHRQVAVKLMLPELVRRAEFRRRFEREAAVVASLAHPRIVAVHESGCAFLDGDDLPYLVMEYVEGETVAERVERLRAGGGRLPVPDALELTAQVLDALDYTHRKGVIHRDIKPSNVMIASDGSIKVMDFGIARITLPAATKLTESGALIGTPHYMAPEQVEGRDAEPASDLYAVGTMLFELLTGETPFHGGSAVEVLLAIVRNRPPDVAGIRPEVGPEVARLVRQSLAKRPYQRPTSARFMASRLRELAEDHRRGRVVLTADIRKPNPPAPRRRTRLRRRLTRPDTKRRLLIRFTALAAAVAAAALVVSAEGWPLGIRPVAARAHPAGWRPWRVKTDGAFAMLPGPGSQSSKLFVTTSTELLALDKDTGRRLWKFEPPTLMTSNSGDLAIPTGSAMYLTSDSTVYALSPSDGRTRWYRRLIPEAASGTVNVAASGGAVYAETPDTVMRLDAATGVTRWKWLPNHCGMDTEKVFTATPDVLLVACRSYTGRSSLDALDTRSGKELWHRNFSAAGMPSIRQSGSRIFYLGPETSEDNNHVATALDLRSGAVLWQHETGTHASLDYVDHRLWQWKDDRLSVLDPATGRAVRTLQVRNSDTADSQHVLAASAGLIVLDHSNDIDAYHPSGGRAWHYRADGLAGSLTDNILVLLTENGPVAIDAVNGAGPCNSFYCPGQVP
ncbi:protein kinase domain-containing protein [Actinomadura parmotrematis]|uniref:Protein kinase n=1 Tax=Actinomadura parmotrematis TaxID=2864039 RepID=A0ABS7FZL1_9ACTN|nr:serine/threonine-protein kinase [Actinomadura parmotrematis]MBW8485885.1 protein kinase [Actinomadura parmotrematis]